MNVLDLALEIGLEPKKVCATGGGEYKSSCPGCDAGTDRFCIWPNRADRGLYWCRKCGCKGDAIQFCRDFMKLSYMDACAKLNTIAKARTRAVTTPFRKLTFSPVDLHPLSQVWQICAKRFIQESHQALLANVCALSLLKRRGFTLDAIKTWRLGWNEECIFDNRTTWGLPSEINDNGKQRTQWLPRGIVIPQFEAGSPVKLKIRRSDWVITDKLPKYVEISGSLQRPCLFGDPHKPIVIMESELDAILTQQFCADICCCMALGGVGKRPDAKIHQLLKNAPVILLALDHDEAGKKETHFWMDLYPTSRAWPAFNGKSPGDAYQLFNEDLRQWVTKGILQSRKTYR